MSDIKTLERKALEIRQRYDQLNKNRDSQPWDALKLGQGFKKDVSDLVAILEQHPSDMRKLNHKLGDCLWSVLVIARKLDIDIERAFWTTMGELEQRFEAGTA